jgi:hypothetical protein
MTIQYEDGVLRCSGVLAVDEAEALLTLLSDHGSARIDLGDCEHVHSACLQVFMAAGGNITTWPASPLLADWLRAALQEALLSPHQ